eukprot:41055_1
MLDYINDINNTANTVDEDTDVNITVDEHTELAMLISMGFSPATGIIALEVSNYNINAAIQYLINQSNIDNLTTINDNTRNPSSNNIIVSQTVNDESPPCAQMNDEFPPDTKPTKCNIKSKIIINLKKNEPVFWFCWHTFDLITDIIVAIQWWTVSFMTTNAFINPEAQATCLSARSTQQKTMNNFAIVLFAVSVIGYILCLYGLCRENGFCISKYTSKAFNYPKILKLYLEDCISILVTAVIAMWYSEMNIWTVTSLLVSGISFVFCFFYEAVYKPCKKNPDNIGGAWVFHLLSWWIYLCGFIVLVIFVALQAGNNTDSSWRIITINSGCYVYDSYDAYDPSAVSYDRVANQGIQCQMDTKSKNGYVVYDITVCNEYYGASMSGKMLAIVQYGSCQTINATNSQFINLYGKLSTHQTRNYTVCYDSLTTIHDVW